MDSRYRRSVFGEALTVQVSDSESEYDLYRRYKYKNYPVSVYVHSQFLTENQRQEKRIGTTVRPPNPTKKRFRICAAVQRERMKVDASVTVKSSCLCMALADALS